MQIAYIFEQKLFKMSRLTKDSTIFLHFLPYDRWFRLINEQQQNNNYFIK